MFARNHTSHLFPKQSQKCQRHKGMMVCVYFFHTLFENAVGEINSKIHLHPYYSVNFELTSLGSTRQDLVDILKNFLLK